MAIHLEYAYEEYRLNENVPVDVGEVGLDPNDHVTVLIYRRETPTSAPVLADLQSPQKQPIAQGTWGEVHVPGKTIDFTPRYPGFYTVVLIAKKDVDNNLATYIGLPVRVFDA